MQGQKRRRRPTFIVSVMLTVMVMAGVSIVSVPAKGQNCFEKLIDRIEAWKADIKQKTEQRRKTLEAAQKREDRDEEEIDYVSMAALLIKDGYYERAEDALKNVDTEAEDLDKARYHTLWGLVYLNRGIYGEARDSFRRAIEEGQGEKIVYLYLAQAHYGLKEYGETIASLDKAGVEADSRPQTYMMRVRSHWELGERPQTFAVLDKGQNRFPQNHEFYRREINLLIRMGLYQEAVNEAWAFLDSTEARPSDYVALGEALRRSRQYEESLMLLESARLLYPENTDVLLSLAHTYLDQGKTYTAARLFEEASIHRPRHTAEAAELYRRSGALDRALYLNARLSDQKTKCKQRLSILLEMKRYEQAAALEGRLSRLGLLKDEKVRYAMAYVFYKRNDYQKAREYLKGIEDPELFRQATDLLKALESSPEDA